MTEMLGLILPAAAIVFPVAHQVHGDAHHAVTPAVELGLAVAADRRIPCKEVTILWTSKRENLTNAISREPKPEN